MNTQPQAFSFRRRQYDAQARHLITHQVAGLPLVRAGGIANAFDDRVRVDFTEAVRAPVLHGAPQPGLDFALLGGEPYARWI